MELRLLTDAVYTEEFDIMVNELTDLYVAGEFQGEERERVEQYFLRAVDRRNRLKFASTLAGYASLEKDGGKVAAAAQPYVLADSNLFQRARTLWRNQSIALRFATAVATVVIVVGLVLLVRPRIPSSETFVALTLTISNDNRSEGAQAKTVKLPAHTDELRISLELPDQMTQSRNYRIELVSENGVSRSLAVAKQDPQLVTVVVPASELVRGRYALRLSTVNADGTEQRIKGSYFFVVE